jgi:YidC/Oxa1 family membrane protein insertase
VDVDIGFQNSSSEEKKLGGYNLCWGPGIAKDEILADMEVAREGPIALVNTEDGAKIIKHWHRTGFACFGGKHVQVPEQQGPISWVGFGSKYFVAVLIPGPDSWWSDMEKGGKRYSIATDVKDTVLPTALPPKDVWNEWGRKTTVALVRPEFSIPAGESVTHQFRVYVGPKKWDILRGIDGRDGSTDKLGLGKMVDFGMFSPLGKATLWLLKVFYRVSNNYGVAIIFMTILIKILYFPLTQKSFKSMRKMQELAPKIAVLKDRHRDDPQRLQKETMKLYKQQGVNPMGGCLPLLFQMPVFWALFTTLRNAVELRGAMFIPGWVTDLSLPDTVAAVAGFPIRVLPILMTGSMLAQQFLFGSGGQTQSNKMMAFMPLIFAFIFYGMPSGLVLYWLCNNILAIGHQYLIRRQQNTVTEEQGENTGKKTRSSSKGD